MLQNSPEGLKTLVLLELTEKLIMHNSPMIFLKKIEKKETQALKKTREDNKNIFERLKQEKKEVKIIQIEKPKMEIPKGIIESRILELKEEIEPKKYAIPQKTQSAKPLPQQMQKPFLRIPETRLPSQFAYLRPKPREINLDLGKLNPLINDSAVKIIESNGPEQQIIVRGDMGTKPTSIILSKEEINNIIYIFAKNAKIPVNRGITEIALGKFVLTAIVSEEGSGFVIKKIPQLNPPIPRGMPMVPMRRF